jgi:hypothetical protein
MHDWRDQRRGAIEEAFVLRSGSWHVRRRADRRIRANYGRANRPASRAQLAVLMPLLGLERFDRRAFNQVLLGLAVGVQTVAEGSQG